MTTRSDVDFWLELSVDLRASDIHFSEDRAPIFRIDGELTDEPSKGKATSAKVLLSWIQGAIDEERFAHFEELGDVDFAVSSSGSHRFRVNAFWESERVAIAVRRLNTTIPSFDDIGLPQVIRGWAERHTGLIIVTGPTGSGKSTTVASMVNYANNLEANHILTIEDPVEYILPDGLGVVRQREVGTDSSDFPRAIRAGLREDLDIMVIGEMRDKETIAAAITVAETGHLVFATLHTYNAPQAIDRIIDAFEPSEQPLIRSRLSSSLIGVVYQRLLPALGGGRVAAYEVLVANSAVKNLIREGKTFHIANSMTTGINEGMQPMERAISQLIKNQKISQEVGNSFIEKNLR